MQYDTLGYMSNVLTSTGRATLALAASQNVSDGELAALLGVDPATVSRKRNGKSGWNDNDALRAVEAFGDRIPGLIQDLERLRATRQYQAPTSAAATSTGQTS